MAAFDGTKSGHKMVVSLWNGRYGRLKLEYEGEGVEIIRKLSRVSGRFLRGGNCV